MDARKGDAGSCCVTRSQTLRASHSPAQVKGKASQSGAVEGGHEVSASRSCSMHEHAEALQLRSDESHRRTKLKPESKRARDKLHLEALEQPRRAQRSMLAQMPQELLEAILSHVAMEGKGRRRVLIEGEGGDEELRVWEGEEEPRSGVYLLFKLCYCTCRRWRDGVLSWPVMRRLSMVGFPVVPLWAQHTRAHALEHEALVDGEQSSSSTNASPPDTARTLPWPEMDKAEGEGEEGLVRERRARAEQGSEHASLSSSSSSSSDALLPAARRPSIAMGGAGGAGAWEGEGEEEGAAEWEAVLEPRAEKVLARAARAGNAGAQFLLGLYLSRQKTFALFCGWWTEIEGGGERGERCAAEVLRVFEEGCALLCEAALQNHPNALYHLGLMSFGGTEAKLRAKLAGVEGGGGDGGQAEAAAESFWERAAERGHLEARLIVDANFRLNTLQDLEATISDADAERCSWRLCAGNRLLQHAKRPVSRGSKPRECCNADCGMYTLLCEFKQCAGCASSHKKQRYCTRACQKRDWTLHRATCGWLGAV